MPAERTCSQCGAPLPTNAPGNRCLKCLLALALRPLKALLLQKPGKETLRQVFRILRALT